MQRTLSLNGKSVWRRFTYTIPEISLYNMHLKRNLNFFISKLLCSLEVGKAGKCMSEKGFSKQFSGWIRDLAGPVLAPRPCVWRLRIKFRGRGCTSCWIVQLSCWVCKAAVFLVFLCIWLISGEGPSCSPDKPPIPLYPYLIPYPCFVKYLLHYAKVWHTWISQDM